MSQDEIIDNILSEVEYNSIYDFCELWVKVSKWSPPEDSLGWRSVFDKMIDEKLIYNRDNELLIPGGQPFCLAPKGLEVKKYGGWLKFSKPTASKRFFEAMGHMSNVGGAVALILLITGSLWGVISWLSNPTLTPPEIQSEFSINKQDSLAQSLMDMDSLFQNNNSPNQNKNSIEAKKP